MFSSFLRAPCKQAKKKTIERKGENGKAQVGHRLLGSSAPSSGLPANRQKRK
jgi:hypothetical protein